MTIPETITVTESQTSTVHSQVQTTLSDTVTAAESASSGEGSTVQTTLSETVSAGESSSTQHASTVSTTLGETVGAGESSSTQEGSTVSTGLSEVLTATEAASSQTSPPLVLGLTLVFAAHSPVNILIVTPNGQEAGFEADGTQVNQVGANLTGPDTEPETVSISNPAIGTYDILVFGKSSAGTGSRYTITVDGSSGGSWSYSGTAQSGSQSSLIVNLSSSGSLSSATGAGGLSATEFFGLLGIITLVGVSAALVLRRRRGRVRTDNPV